MIIFEKKNIITADKIKILDDLKHYLSAYPHDSLN